MKRVYICGPISTAPDGGPAGTLETLSNIREGISMASCLIANGFAVFCPHLDFMLAFTGMGPLMSKAHYQKNSLAFVDVCDAMITIGHYPKSRGCEREIARARALGIPTFIDMKALLEWDRNTPEHPKARPLGRLE